LERGAIKMEIDHVFATSVERAKRWHPGGVEDWSPLEWAGAMCGEAGEAANAAKKLKRIETGLQNINAGKRSLVDLEIARGKVADEVADTILYGLLLMARVGIESPERILARVFNAKSVEYGFPERL
jgi:NTP pyrophosphatase (non-canonical NTP hydrolase)